VVCHPERALRIKPDEDRRVWRYSRDHSVAVCDSYTFAYTFAYAYAYAYTYPFPFFITEDQRHDVFRWKVQRRIVSASLSMRVYECADLPRGTSFVNWYVDDAARSDDPLP
jgi:hypothetical protein